MLEMIKSEGGSDDCRERDAVTAVSPFRDVMNSNISIAAEKRTEEGLWILELLSFTMSPQRVL